MRTLTETVTWFGGYTGGVRVDLYDASGNLIQYDPIRYRYGVDGRAFGSGSRDDTETRQLPQNIADPADLILITHYWDPKVDLVARTIELGGLIWDVIKALLDAQKQGEPINAGGEPY